MSASLYDAEFPDDSDVDCSQRRTRDSKCFGNADTYHNYREAKVVNIKHHWFWKLNYINQNFKFEKLILLEEDHQVTPDFLYVADLLENFAKTHNKPPVPRHILTLGTYKSKMTENPAG